MMLLALATLSVMLGTAWVGWTAIPAIGLAMGLLLPHDRPVLTMTMAAPSAWGILLVATALRGPALELADLIGTVFGGLPGPVVILLTLLFPALLGLAAAGLGRALRELRGDPVIE